MRIADGAVTRIHCRILVERGELRLVDESRYGTLVNGQRVDKTVRLGLGDVIDVCGHILTIAREPEATVRDKQSSHHDGDNSSATGELSQQSLQALRQSVPPQNSRLHVDVIEDPHAAPRYRDAVQLAGRRVLLVMTDIRSTSPLPPTFLAELKATVRKIGSTTEDAGSVLEHLGKHFLDSGVQAAGMCVLANPETQMISVACAGTESPWVLRGGSRIARSQGAASVELGRVRGAQFPSKLLHFAQGDVLLVPSLAWNAYLGNALIQDFRSTVSISQWLRQVPNPPSGGSVLCLTFA